MEVDIRHGVAFVTTTDVRNAFTTIYRKVLEEHGRIVVEKNGRPVAEIRRPGEDVQYERRRY